MRNDFARPFPATSLCRVIQVFAMGAVLLALIPCAFTQESAGAEKAKTVTIRGRVVDETGAGVFGAVVQPGLLPTEGARPHPVHSRADTGIDGAFELTGIPAGLYRICAQKPGSELLDPCDWGDTALRVSVDGTQDIADLRVVMETGELLRVQVDDPTAARELLTQDHTRRSTVLFLAVRGTQGPRKLSLLRDTESGAEYGTAIPKNRDVEVFVGGVNLEIRGRIEATAEETVVPARGNVFAVTQRFRQEKSPEEPHLRLSIAASPGALQ